MTDTHHSEAEHDAHVRSYLVVFGALAIFTLVSFVANYAAHPERAWIGVYTSFLIILVVAVVKATLVGMYFMHLKVDWPRFYFLLIPAFILGTMMMIVLLPDIVIAWGSN
jgi:cytochrome c oxidase subunit 4